jgi:RNA-directed DNA polymerase
MQTSLQGIAQRAKEQKKHRFQDLYRMLNKEFLLDNWRNIRKEAAYGVDKVSVQRQL